MDALTNTQKPKVNWLSVTVFYIIACAISWPFFWWRDVLHWQGFQGPGLLKTVPIMWGPGVAGLISLLLFRKTHTRTISFFGSDYIRTLIFYLAPFIVLAAFGVKGKDGTLNHVVPLAVPLMGLFTVLGEEVGWRGFLQDALRSLSPVKRYIIIGVLWELWHFTNRTHGKELPQILITWAAVMPITILLSWIIGEATDRSKAIFVAAALHGWVDILFEMPGMGTYISLGIAIILWILLLKNWNRPYKEMFSLKRFAEPATVMKSDRTEVI